MTKRPKGHGKSLHKKKNTPNEVFLQYFFKSALDFHGGDDERGHSPPKSIAAPSELREKIMILIYRIGKNYLGVCTVLGKPAL